MWLSLIWTKLKSDWLLVEWLSKDARHGHAARKGPYQARSSPGHAFQEAAPVNAVLADLVMFGAESEL